MSPSSDSAEVGLSGVTYDFWNTIFAESSTAFEARLNANVAILAERGIEVDHETMRTGMGRGWEWYRDRWLRNVQTRPVEAVERLLEILGVESDAVAVRQMVEVVVEGTDPATMSPAPGVAEVLDAWRERGVRVGVICDVGITPSTTLRRYLDGHDLLDRFDHLTFSDDVGLYKPHPGVFDSARRGLGLGPAELVAHVGDLVRTDVAGALGAGWRAVRYRGLRDDREGLESEGIDAHHVIDEHHELLAIYG